MHNHMETSFNTAPTWSIKYDIHYFPNKPDIFPQILFYIPYLMIIISHQMRLPYIAIWTSALLTESQVAQASAGLYCFISYCKGSLCEKKVTGDTTQKDKIMINIISKAVSDNSIWRLTTEAKTLVFFVMLFRSM